MVLFCSVLIIVLNAIPNLKYVFFSGTADTVAHFGNTNEMLALGRITTTGYYGQEYYDYPGLHVLLASMSSILGVDLNISQKIFSSLIFGLVPSMLYLLSKSIFDEKFRSMC